MKNCRGGREGVRSSGRYEGKMQAKCIVPTASGKRQEEGGIKIMVVV